MIEHGDALIKAWNNFKFSDFADKISGKNEMKPSTITRLQNARDIAKVPFIINSGYRDENHPETIANPTSSHNKGYAVDIHVDNTNRKTIESALRSAGFTRIGIGANFIHADDDPDKVQNVTWFYDGRATLHNYNKVYSA